MMKMVILLLTEKKMEDEVNSTVAKYKLLDEMQKTFEWGKWQQEIPYLQFKPEWEVRAIPPFQGAIIRYNIKYFDKVCSIYLDCYDMLGHMGEPYWELFPDSDGETFRCGMNETDKLITAIEHSLQCTDEEIFKGMVNKGLLKTLNDKK